MKTSLDILADFFEESVKAARTKDVKSLEHRDFYMIARLTVTGLRRALVDFIPMTPCATFIGRDILASIPGREDMTKKDKNLQAFKVGYHFLHEMAKLKIISIGKDDRKKRAKYMVFSKNIELVDDLLGELLDFSSNSKPTFIEPQYKSPDPYDSFHHEIAGPLVRNSHPLLGKGFISDEQERVLELINKLMDTKYAINTDLLEVLDSSKDDSLFTFADKTLDDTQRKSKIREQKEIMRIAFSVYDKHFYQYMFYDWRGRVYSATNYLNHTGHKLAKALICLDEKKPIKTEGYFFLLVHAANCWGEDKSSIDERYNFVAKKGGKLDEWMEIAKDPINNKVWQSADSPFEFLAAILEIKKSHEHPGSPYDYPSGLLVAWDATCSGLQVLAALCRDQHSGLLSNIAYSEKRGDYYQMIADHIWKDCVYTEQDERAYDKLMLEAKGLEKAITEAETKEERDAAWIKKVTFGKANGKNMYALAKVFWGRLERKSRKTVKRGCMTYFYSCGEETMADALVEDFSPEPEYDGLNAVTALWLSKRIYRACKELMPKPTELMELFVEMGLRDYKKDEDFSITAPFTDFKVMQYYREDSTRQVSVNYLGKRIRPVVAIGKDDLKDKGKVESGTSPNVVHMLDAALLAAIVLKAEYTVSCVHDSFAASVADASKLFEDTRIAFYDIFSEDVLTFLTEQKGMENNVEYGTLRLADVFLNEQCFS